MGSWFKLVYGLYVVLAIANVLPSYPGDWSLPMQWLGVFFALMTVCIIIGIWVCNCYMRRLPLPLYASYSFTRSLMLLHQPC